MGAVGCSFPTQMSVRPCHLLGVEPGQLQRWGLRQGGWTSVSLPGCAQGQRSARGGVSWDIRDGPQRSPVLGVEERPADAAFVLGGRWGGGVCVHTRVDTYTQPRSHPRLWSLVHRQLGLRSPHLSYHSST